MSLRDGVLDDTTSFMSLWHKRYSWMMGTGLFMVLALSACGTKPAHPVEQSGVVESLQKQIRERDKRIEELESQLNALKVIDQDVEKLRRSARPPATLTPIQ